MLRRTKHHLLSSFLIIISLFSLCFLTVLSLQGFPQHSNTSDADFCIDVLNGLIEADDSPTSNESEYGSFIEDRLLGMVVPTSCIMYMISSALVARVF
jgi:hypothetical protein